MEKIKLIDTDTMDYLVTGTHANIGIDIWIKFTSHFKEAEIKFLERMKNNVFNMSIDEIDLYTRLTNQSKMADLLKKYKERKCTKKEHDIVKKFMNDNKLEMGAKIERFEIKSFEECRHFVDSSLEENDPDAEFLTNCIWEAFSDFKESLPWYEDEE